MPGNPPPVTVYGIANCDSVKKSRAWLTEHGIGYQFHDYKKQGLTPELLDPWLAQAGWERLLNRKGTTWRRLDDATRAAVTGARAARSLMLAQPSLVKRPVVEWSGSLTVGYDPLRWAALAGQ